MKKLAIATSLVAALAGVSTVQAASTGTITFNGLLTATTCNVVVDNQTEDATVTLPTLGTNVLDESGKTAGRTRFNMALTQCTGALRTASAFFQDGATVDSDTGRLNSSGTAENVQLQLRDGTGAARSVIKVGDPSQVDTTRYVSIASASANLPYSVEYYATDATTAGTVVSSVVYNIQYK